jgi:hypothetical protein
MLHCCCKSKAFPSVVSLRYRTPANVLRMFVSVEHYTVFSDTDRSSSAIRANFTQISQFVTLLVLCSHKSKRRNVFVRN